MSNKKEKVDYRETNNGNVKFYITPYFMSVGFFN